MDKHTGQIANINNKYVIINDIKFINETPILFSLLPNDIVEYEVILGKINIIRLIERKPQIIMGIIKSLELNKAVICVPGLPKFFSLKINNQNNELTVYSIVILKISINNVEVVEKYDSIRNRINDKSIFVKMYNENSSLCKILPDYVDSESFYSNEIKDLTHLYSFNIDPTESKDFDDAISIDENENKIYIHIVDANEQILKRDEIDINALKQSFTLYLPEHIQNILPSELAENKLSLIRGEDRKTITTEFLIDPINQNILNYSIYKSIIKIKKRYDYEEFNTDLFKFPKLYNFYKRWKRETLNIPHVKLIIDKSTGKLINSRLENNFDDAHKVVETLMILTNLTISKHVSNLFPQRYHSKIKNEFKIESFTNNEIIDSILTIKKFKSAIYDQTKSGHFGLGLSTYTHFTSPIRRYFDVIVHRNLAGVKYTNIEDILDHINNREKYIEKLVECYNNLKFLSYFEENINNIWSCYIISIKSNGLVVMLDENLYEIFIFDSNSTNYKIGDKVNVKIKSIDWINLNVKAKIM